MDLSPNDIRNCEFTTQMRGYSREEVDGLLEQVATVLETVKQENLKLSMEVDSLKTQLAALRQFEDTIKSAAIDARRHADETISSAKQEAEKMLSEAKSESERILGSREHQLGDLEGKISAAEATKTSYLAKVRSVISSHLQLIDELIETEPMEIPESGEATPTNNGAIEVTDSSEVERKKLETVGTPSAPEEPTETEEATAETDDEDEAVEEETAEHDETAEVEETVESEQTVEDAKPQPIDPELADALEKYQTSETEAATASAVESPTGSAPPPPGQLVETTARAEDIPQGFVVGPSGEAVARNPEEEVATDKMSVDAGTAKINTQPPPEPTPSKRPATPEDLAQELDKVVAKFEEEMDKAAKA